MLKKYKIYKFYLVLLPFYFLLFTFFGCAPTQYIKPTIPTPSMPGTYHRVLKGQTLWRISKIYNADLDEIARINRIFDSTKLETGQLVFIPGANRPEYSPAKYSSDDFIWPLEGKTISTFGQIYDNMINKGINIRPYGNLDVKAAQDGKVVFSSDDFSGFGRTIIIDHGNGFSTIYARNAELYKKAGENVQKGLVIAKAGSLEKDRDVYLHFEIRKGHTPKNPYYYLP